ncbi:MAG: tetratricopeptide repeat protein [Terracidiphilus sp.]
MRVLPMIVLGSLLGASAAVYCQTQADLWSQCSSNDADTVIAGCTVLIQSGQLKGTELAMAFSNQGYGYFQKAQYDQALQDYNQALRIDPKFELAWENRAALYLQKGQYDQAIQDVSQVLLLDPNASNATSLYTFRAIAYDKNGEYSQAIADYSQVIALQPNNADALNGRCYDSAIVGQLQSALSDCNQSLTVRPNDADTLDSRCFVYLKMNNPDAAIADCNAALATKPQLASSLYSRGLAERIKGDTADSNTDIAAAKAIQSNIDSQYANWGVPAPTQ